MLPPGFKQALIDYADAIDDISVLEEERDALYARMKNGESGVLVNSTINGKSFGFQGSVTIEEKFTAYVQAIKEIKGRRIRMTYGDFSGITR